MASTALERFFATCPRGLEAALADELTVLGVTNARATEGGVSFEGRQSIAYTINLWSRLASRVLWQVGFNRYRDQQDIYDAALKLNWPRWFDVRNTIRVNVTAIRSPLTSIDFITLKIKDAIVDRFRSATGERPSVDTAQPGVRIHAFLTRDTCTFYLDTSGEALFKRGYRHGGDLGVEAPLRENLSAGLLVLSGWAARLPSGAGTLLDPFCGGGTIVIEAAMMAADIAPGLGRSFGFEQLSWHDAAAWKQRVDEAQRRADAGRTRAAAARSTGGSAQEGDEGRAAAGAQVDAHAPAVAQVDALAHTPAHAPGPEPTHGRIAGSDTDWRAIASARANAEAAGVDKLVEFSVADALSVEPPAATGTIVTNPPYGVRLGATDELRVLYAAFADTLKRRFAGWDAWVLCGELSLVKAIRLQPSRRIPLFNGAIECRLVEYRLVSGSNRRIAPSTDGASGKITTSNEEQSDG